jgi:toxin CcdB
MARFDVYRNAGAHAAETPYLLDVQCNLLEGLETRVVVPLRRRDRFPFVNLPANLTPTFTIEGVECILETPNLAAVPGRILRSPVMSLMESQFEIVAALDFLFQGF